jgi:hypothetical protein
MSLITVGLPVYNSMPYLRESVNSLLSQTVNDFKMLAVVDDSDDGSVEYMESLKDSRLRVLRQPKSGLTPALNRMLDEVETPWLVRQDADDVSYPTRMEKLLDAIRRYPDAGMVSSLAEYYPPNRSLGTFRCSRGTPAQFRNIVKSGYLLTFCHSSVALNVPRIRSLGGFRENVPVEDADLWWRVALEFDIYLLPEKLVGYRHHPAQSINESKVQIVGLLYVQYLLLSHLWGLCPQPKDRIYPILSGFVSDKSSSAKDLLRQVNIDLAANQYLHAIVSFVRACFASPTYVTKRLRDEIWPGRNIANGLKPELFLAYRSELWPDKS